MLHDLARGLILLVGGTASLALLMLGWRAFHSRHGTLTQSDFELFPYVDSKSNEWQIGRRLNGNWWRKNSVG